MANFVNLGFTSGPKVDSRITADVACAKTTRAPFVNEDAQLIVREALCRLRIELRDTTKIVFLVRFVLNGESRESLAKEYGVAANYVSLQKSRYLKRLQELVREVQTVDEQGRIEPCNWDISFLEPCMAQWNVDG